MRPALLAPLLLLSGCLLGVDPYKGAFTPRVEEIRLVEPSVPAEDGQIYAREGTEVVVDIVTTYPIVVGDTGGEGGTGDGPRGPVTQILLEGATEPFEVVEQLDETTWRFRKVLTKDDGNGPKTIRATVVNDFDQAATDASDVLLIADFQAPTAACVLSPRVANTVNTPTLVVTLSEPLQGGLPVVTPSTPDILIDPNPRVVEGQIVYELAGALGANVEDYVLTVTGTDLAGNPQQGDSMCEALDRTGTVLARVPQIVPGQDVRVAATPSVAVEEPVDGLPTLVPRARVGAVVTVEIPTVDPIVPERSTVSLSGLELTHVEGITWSHTLTGNEGEGLKTLDVWLVDAAENTTRLPSRKGVLRFDFTPPAADCVLQPKGANADQQVRFDVFASEALDVGVPAVTADHPNVVVEHDTSVGTQHSFLVRLKEPGNADYVLTVEGNDVAGNPPLGPLCDASERTGTIRGIPPMVAGPPVITTSPSVEVDEDGTVVPRVR
ncbi:MAG: hypothetical protein KC656_25700, partial [Myxococcales bacterium]|nr:hypothetical protein [Myxococcales bacterium]